MRSFTNFNGKIFKGSDPVIGAADHSYRYGDGLFETMRMREGKILYEAAHFERLFQGLTILKFDVPGSFTQQKITGEISALCKKNQCERSARLRLSVSRGNGGLYDCDNRLSYLVECWPLEPRVLNENGLIIDIFPDAKKSTDIFSNIKSANYLPYTMAATWAKENKLNEALLLNCHQRICDSTIANVFWAKNGEIFTPSLNEGCVAGVMRRQLLERRKNILESDLTEDILLNADEVFLTNVTTGLRWVKQFRNKTYTNVIASKLFAEIEQTII